MKGIITQIFRDTILHEKKTPNVNGHDIMS